MDHNSIPMYSRTTCMNHCSIPIRSTKYIYESRTMHELNAASAHPRTHRQTRMHICADTTKNTPHHNPHTPSKTHAHTPNQPHWTRVSHTNLRIMSQIWMSHVKHMHPSCHELWINMHESCDPHARVMSHTCCNTLQHAATHCNIL